MVIVKVSGGECAVYPLTVELEELARFVDGREFIMMVK